MFEEGLIALRARTRGPFVGDIAMNEWFEAEQRAERAHELFDSGRWEDALRELVERFHGTRSVSGQAQEVRRRALRYAASAWRFDRDRDAMPPRYDGTQKEYLWRAFKAGAAMPLSERQLRSILAH